MWSFGRSRWFNGVNWTRTFQPTFSQCSPVLPDSRGLRALPTVRLRDADCGDDRIHEREHNIAGRHFAHGLVNGFCAPFAFRFVDQI